MNDPTPLKPPEAIAARHRCFWTTTIIAISIWMICGGIYAAFLMAYREVWFWYSNEMELAAECCNQLASAFQTTIALQLAVWWHWRWPNKSSRWELLGLNLIFTCFGLAVLVPQYQPLVSNHSIATLTAISFLFLFIEVPIFMLFMHIPTQLFQFHLIDQNSCDSTDPGNAVRPKQTNWSLKGLFAATLLAAVMFALYQAMRRYFASISDPTTSVFYPSNDFVMLLHHAFEVSIALTVFWAAAWATRNQGRRIGVIVLFLVVAIQTIGDVAFAIVWYGHDPMYYESWKVTFAENAFSNVACYQLSRWFFKRWSKAGYVLTVWIRGRSRHHKQTA